MNENIERTVLATGVTIKLPNETKQTIFGNTKEYEGANVVINSFAVTNLVEGAIVTVTSFEADKALLGFSNRQKVSRVFKELLKLTDDEKDDLNIIELSEDEFKIDRVKYRMFKADTFDDGVFTSHRLISSKGILIAISCEATTEAVVSAVEDLLQFISIDAE